LGRILSLSVFLPALVACAVGCAGGGDVNEALFDKMFEASRTHEDPAPIAAPSGARAGDESTTNTHFAVMTAALTGNEAWLDRIAFEGWDIDARDDQFGQTAFHNLVLQENRPTAARLLERGARVNTRSRYSGSTPLHDMVNVNNAPMVAWLLDEGAAPNLAEQRLGHTPLLSAATENRIEIMELLLISGADPNHKNAQDVAPLHLAASMGHLPAVQLLVQYGADINLTTTAGSTPLDVARRRDRKHVIDYLEPLGERTGRWGSEMEAE